MLLKQTIHKSRSLVRKTIRNLKSFFFGRYQKLPKSFSFNSFSFGSRKLKSCKTDQIFTDLYEEWETQLDETTTREDEPPSAMKEAGNALCNGNLEGKFPSKSHVPVVLKEKKAKKSGSSRSHQGKGNDEVVGGGGIVLAQRMKDLEMIDSSDMEQSLDIEEAMHYYSRLKSPVYLDIVDKFFVDMYSELSVPHNQPSVKINKHASARINNSKRRLGSFRL